MRDWTHADVEYRLGDQISLPEAIAEKLARLGAGEVVTPQPDNRRKPKRK
jgi:hypothetical protein